MNVNDVEITIPARDPDEHETWVYLLKRRRSTYQGFAVIEEQGGGILSPQLSLATARGQEAIRVLVMRVLEELMEAEESTEAEHFEEELIDALNYAWVLLIGDPTFKVVENESVTRFLSYSWRNREFGDDVTTCDLFRASGELLETLRNRAWQHNAQSLYFDGWPVLVSFVLRVSRYVFSRFKDWPSFWKMFLAKDEVLKFRLSTSY